MRGIRVRLASTLRKDGDRDSGRPHQLALQSPAAAESKAVAPRVVSVGLAHAGFRADQLLREAPSAAGLPQT